jgi:hypothetical protein
VGWVGRQAYGASRPDGPVGFANCLKKIKFKFKVYFLLEFKPKFKKNQTTLIKHFLIL